LFNDNYYYIILIYCKKEVLKIVKEEKKLNNKEEKVEIQAPKKVKYQCLHSDEPRECTCARSKGLVLIK